MTNEQTAILMRMIIQRIDEALKSAKEELPTDCSITRRNMLGQDVEVFPALFKLEDIRSDLNDMAESLEGSDG